MATIPVEITWTTGQIVTAAQLNANLRDAINFLLNPPMAVIKQTVSQALPASGWTTMTWDAEEKDPDNGHSTAVNTSRYTVATPGFWDLRAKACVNNIAASGWTAASFIINGSVANRWGKGTQPTNLGAPTSTHAVDTLFLNTNDFVEVQAADGTTTAGSTAVTSEDNSRWTLRWCSN